MGVDCRTSDRLDWFVPSNFLGLVRAVCWDRSKQITWTTLITFAFQKDQCFKMSVWTLELNLLYKTCKLNQPPDSSLYCSWYHGIKAVSMKIDSFDLWCQRRILCVHCSHHVSNYEIKKSYWMHSSYWDHPPQMTTQSSSACYYSRTAC